MPEAQDDDGWFDQAMAPLMPFTSPDPVGGAGGSWSLSEDQMEALIKRLEAVEGRIDLARQRAKFMARIEPPGADPHSASVAKVMNDSGLAYLDSLESQISYMTRLRESMQRTLNAYRGIENDNSGMIWRAAGNAEGSL